jgi:hypothetical protein
LLRSLQEIQPDFEEEDKAYAGLWSQGKKKEVIGLRVRLPDFDSRQPRERNTFPFVTSPRLVLGSTQPPIQ